LLPPLTKRAPLYPFVVLSEAIDVATMLTHYWDPKTDAQGNTIPGFSGVATAGTVKPEVATEIRELQLAVAAAHSEYLVLVQGSAAAPLDRAADCVQEPRRADTWLAYWAGRSASPRLRNALPIEDL
jgi:hypothetical protein